MVDFVQSGYGLHAVWLLREPSRDKARWRVIQRAIVRGFADYGADPVCAPNEACTLRLVPYPNRKLSPTGVPTALVMESGTKYDLAALLDAFASPAATAFHDIPGPAPPFVPPPEAGSAGVLCSVPPARSRVRAPCSPWVCVSDDGGASWQWICNSCRPLVVVHKDGTRWRS
jgi:hypothetical protein